MFILLLQLHCGPCHTIYDINDIDIVIARPNHTNSTVRWEAMHLYIYMYYIDVTVWPMCKA